MNCDLVQRRLLASESPDQPSVELRRHLTECASCCVWQRRLMQMEQQLPLLATPPSQRKAEVVRLILDATPPPFAPLSAFTTPPRERGLRKASLAIAMAAALATFAVGWLFWVYQPESPAHVDPLASFRVERAHRLAKAPPTPQGRVEALADLADQHHKEALKLAQQGDTDKLANLAKFYVELVHRDLLADAKQLPPAELTKIADRLQRTESELSHMASDAKLTKANKAALEEMAVATRSTHARLLEILNHQA